MKSELWTTKEFAAILGTYPHRLIQLASDGVIRKPHKHKHAKNRNYNYWDSEHLGDFREYERKKKQRAADKKVQRGVQARELAEQFGVSIWTIYALRKRGILPEPYGGRRWATYGQEHYDALEKYFSIIEKRKALILPSINRKHPNRHSISNATRAKVWEICEGRCTYCDVVLNPFLNFHVDHVVPVARGGTNSLENLTGACSTCNMSKGAKEEFLPAE